MSETPHSVSFGWFRFRFRFGWYGPVIRNQHSKLSKSFRIIRIMTLSDIMNHDQNQKLNFIESAVSCSRNYESELWSWSSGIRKIRKFPEIRSLRGSESPKLLKFNLSFKALSRPLIIIIIISRPLRPGRPGPPARARARPLRLRFKLLS